MFAPGRAGRDPGLEHLDRAVAAGRRVIIFSGHLGNWEIAALAAANRRYSVQAYGVAQIYRAANNPLVDRLIARLRGDRRRAHPEGRGRRRGARWRRCSAARI